MTRTSGGTRRTPGLRPRPARPSRAPARDARERVLVASREAWRTWLAAHHATAPGIWLVSWRAGSGRPRVPYEALVEEALAFGWIDSLPRKLDADRTMLLLTPRKPGSAWAAANKARVARLEADGHMTPAGLAVVRAAQADGSWTRIDAAQALEVPPDLAAALAARPGARQHWAAFPPSTRRGILEWILQARRPATRARRVETTAAEAAVNRRANSPSRRPAARGPTRHGNARVNDSAT
jgi:uncharacterized protein YdeI (YjbR/CyaY-like superfamily)